MKTTKYIIIALACMFSSTSMTAQVVINEIMQSNIDCIMDETKQFPDSWVELYNNGTTVVNLSEYKIGDTDDAASAWKLPSQTLAPKNFALIYCDKEANGMHTNFRLETGKGCQVFLFNKNGNVVDQVKGLKKQPAPNIAYGRKTDASAEWGYMLTPTPNSNNKGGIVSADNILGEPIFSIKGCVLAKKKNMELTLSIPEGSPSGTKIVYTIDGSEPTTTSTTYTTPINIISNKIIRAKLVCDGYLSPYSSVQSYLFLEREITLPVVSIVIPNKYLNDKAIGIYVEGLKEDGKENFKHDWRRPINIEMYEKDGTTCVINQLCETRIQGGASREAALKSLALYANKRFGTKRFAYEFFPDQKPGLNNFKSILLRNAGNDFDYLYMRDAVIQRTMAKNTDVDWQAWRPAIVFINGTYRGILNIRERSNDDNIYSNYNELEDIDLIENWNDLKTGTKDKLNAFKAFYNEHDHTMAEYSKWMDIEEFINLMIANLFYCNLDFPGNNIVMWRPRTEEGKWRWIMKDTDFGLGLYNRDVNYNTIEWIYNNSYDQSNSWGNTYDATRLFRRLMEDKDFNREFIDHCAIYMGDFLNEKGTRELWDPMYEIIKSEYPNHRKLFNQWWPNYDSELNNARNWLKQRPEKFYQFLANYYKLGTPAVLKINSSAQASYLNDVTIFVNGIRLSKGNLDGKFFPNRKLTLSALPGKQRNVAGWKITTVNGANTSIKTVNASSHTMTVPTCSALLIEAIFEATTGITETETYKDTKPKKIIKNGKIIIQKRNTCYDIMGIRQ